MLPFTNAPFLDTAPMPLKNVRGTESTKAQGQDATKKTKALDNHCWKSPTTIVGRTVKATAKNTTTGVYILANFVIKFSVLDLLAVAFSTISIILATVESSNLFCAFI